MPPLKYDKTIQTVTTIDRVRTVHIQQIDWDGYDFFAKDHLDRWLSHRDGIEGAKVEIQKRIDLLKKCSQFDSKPFRVGNYNHTNEVIGVGMVSAWPYWESRPMVCVNGPLGAEWQDWLSLDYGEKV